MEPDGRSPGLKNRCCSTAGDEGGTHAGTARAELIRGHAGGLRHDPDTLGKHPLAFIRSQLSARRYRSSSDLAKTPHGGLGTLCGHHADAAATANRQRRDVCDAGGRTRHGQRRRQDPCVRAPAPSAGGKPSARHRWTVGTGRWRAALDRRAMENVDALLAGVAARSRDFR